MRYVGSPGDTQPAAGGLCLCAHSWLSSIHGHMLVWAECVPCWPEGRVASGWFSTGVMVYKRDLVATANRLASSPKHGLCTKMADMIDS